MHGIASRLGVFEAASYSLPERRFPLEPQKSDKSVEPRGEDQTSPPRQPERKRRFLIVKLEERIAPGRGGHTHNKPACR